MALMTRTSGAAALPEAAAPSSASTAVEKESAKSAASYSPRQVLIIGEGGSGAEMLSQLFARSAHYMLWREPHNWRFSAHMPDELLGAMLGGLFRCEVRRACALCVPC